MIYDFQELADIFSQIPTDAPKDLAVSINAHQRIFVHGAGRSGLMLKAFAMRLAQAGRTVYVAGETVTPAIDDGDVLILASASGKTSSVICNAQTAKKVGAAIYSLTATADSPLAALSDELVIMPASTKDSATSHSIMGTGFEQALLLFFDMAVLELGEDTKKMRSRHSNLE